MQAALSYATLDPSEHVDQRVVLHDVSWAEYEALLRMRGDNGGVRVAYLEGELELMTPSRHHESYKKRIARLLEAWALTKGIPLNGFGSWTVKNAPKARGVEPDECYILGNRSVEVPDLAIEVRWTHGGLDKLTIFAGLKVGEVWFWNKGVIEVYVLVKGKYRRRRKSTLLPLLNLALLETYVHGEDQTAAARAYLKALQSGT